ncbi:obscurin isoform X7 [Diabrotica virgifera virgifera]|uniref:Obscurin n=1 Tax=Diabrotica virgifera virgifera TaxID=50390 RepID=A0ABM5IQH2_DIAVI|nr:obscurin isoform X7 [Diabrotica virgifera virgifera]
MASSDKDKTKVVGEILVAWKKYTANSDDEINLLEGDVVELLDINDPNPSKRIKLDPDLDSVSGELLDNPAAHHKLSLKPKRTHTSSRHSPTRLNISQRWLVRQVNGGKKQGWVPCGVLQTADDPTLSKTGLPGDAEFRRQAVVKELIETEIEFVRDLDLVVQRYLIPSESGKVPKIIKDNFDLVFGNFKEIAEFHRTVLVEGVKFNANQPVLIGKTFLRLERDFDKHVAYCRDEPMAQEFLEHCDAAFDYFNELSLRFGDDKSISEHLKLPIQRINDYQLLLKELVRYTTCLGENYVDLQKALDLMLSVPHRAQDDKFISSIEGYKGSVHKLGRLLAHDRFTITFEDISKERYLFLFKARILVCKVRRISEDRSIFQLKDCIRLTKVTVKDHPEDKHVFELIDNVGGQAIILKVYRDVKEYWLKEIREFAKEHGDSEETSSDDLKSPPAEKSDETKRKPTEKLSQKESELPKPKKLKPEPPTLEVSKESEVKQGSTKTKLEESLLRRKLSKELDQPNKKNGSSIPVPKSIKEKSTVDTKKEEPKLKPVEETKTTGPKVLATVEKNKTEQLLEQKVAVVEKSKEDEKKELVQEKVTSKLPSKSKTQDKLIEELKLKQSKVEQSSTRTKESLTEVRQSISELSQSKTEFSSTEAAETRTQESSVAVTKSKASQKTETSKTKTSLEERKSSSISSEDTVVPAFVAPVETTTTTTDIQRSDSETLKQISTPESDPSEDQHSRRLQAVEPLIEINKPRVLEEAIPYTIKPPPEKVPGSAIDKLYSVEKTGVSDIVLTDFKVGIEVNVEVGDEMSRKYTSSSRSEGGYESSYSRRAGSTEGGLSSSRYSSEISSSKYGTDSSLTGRSSKYESLSSKYANKYSTDLGDSSALTSSYSSRKALGGDDDVTSSYTSRKARGESELTSSYSSRKALGDGDNDYSYTRKSRYSVDDDDGGSSYSYSRKVTKDGDDGDAYSSYSKRSSRSLTRTEGLGDDDSYTFSRRSIKSRTEGIGDGDNYSVRRSIKTSVEGTGIEPTETNDTYSYSSKRGLGADLGSKYSIRSVSIEEEKSDTDELLSKYSKYAINKKLNEDEEEDKYAKYTRKYSRNESITDKKDEDENKYTRKYSRTSSREPKKDDEEDPYEKYARKYLRRDSQLDEQNKSRRSESHERKSRYSDHEGESTSVKISSETEIKELSTGKSEVLVSKEVKSESFVQESIESAKSEAKESRAESKVELIAEAKSIEADYQKSEKVSQEASESVSKKSTSEKSTKESSKMAETKSEKKEVSKTTSVEATSIHEKSAEEKLEELVDGRPKFIQTIRGTSIEPGETAQFGITLSSKPASFAWLKNNKPISNADSRIQVSYNEKTHECKLSIKETTKEDSGMYIAVAKNEKGESTCSAQLVVHELTTEERAAKSSTDKPEFLVSMKNAELLEETYLRFMVKVAGEPHPDIAFFKQGKKIPENSERYQIIKEKAHIGFYELVIPVVKKEDAGVYKCVATNKHGEASSEANLTVTDNKKIFEEMPEGEILPAGEKPVFHWKKDGQPFEPEERFKVLMGDDEDSLALVFQKVRPDDVGLYTCVAQTSRGHISCSAELTVHGTVNQLFREPEKPQLVVIKKDPVVNVGGSAMLELQVKGYPKPNIKFMHEGKQIEASKKHKILYEDEESVSLVIKDVESSDAGKYTFTAENELGIDTAEMNLTVKANTTPTQDSEECSLTLTIAPPRIKTKLEDMSVHADQQLKIDIEIEGIPKPTVKFYKDGKVIKESENIKVVESGEKLTLIIEKTSLKDSGSYSVVATNEMAQVSQFWNLEVYSKPKVIQKLGADRQLSQGQNLELKVKLESEPKAEVKWFKDEEEIKSNEHYTIKEDGDSYMLKITGAVTTDAARFKCRALNIHGSVDDEVRVDVKKPPKIIQGLRDMTVVEHDKNVSLDVKLEAFPKPTVKWYLDEVEIKETRTEFTRIESDDGASLIIKEVTSQLSGQYTCKLSNECGGVETSAKLTVNCAPRIIKHLKDTTVEEGSTLHLEVEVEGCPSPTVKWLRNGREVSADARIKITKDTQRHETFNLAVNLIKYEEQGEYEVIVTNSLGTVSSKSIVTVHKVTHTDAIEETEVIEVLEKPKAAKVAEIEEKIEEKVEDPKQPEIEDVEEKPKKPKAEPMILGTNMKDGSRPESLDITYIVKGFANPPPVATWTLDGKELKPDGNLRMNISQNGDEYKLEIKKLELKDAGVYQCILSNPVGKVVQQAVLDVTPEKELRRPKIKEALKDQSIVKKTTAAFKAVIVGDPVPDIAWCKNGKEISDEEFEKQKAVLESEDTEIEDGLKECTYSLALPRCETSATGKYTIKAKNKWGEAESSAHLSIVMRPEIDGPHDVKVVPGDATEFTVVIQANPEPQVVWTKDGVVVQASDLIKIVEDKVNKTYKLVFNQVLLGDEGYYKVTATNELGDASSEARLKTIKEAEPTTERPKFITGLVDDQVEHKGEVTLMVRADGLPKPEIRWFFNGKPITEDDNRKIVTTSDAQVTSKLIIKNFGESTAGIYKAMAINVVGEAETTSRVTMLQTPPSFGKKLDRNMDVNEGEPLELKAKVNGSPKPEATWFKDGEPISPDDENIKISILPDGTIKLNIAKCKPSDSGAYKLVVKNPNGESACLCAVAVIPKPKRPTFLKCFKDAQVPLGESVRLEAKVEAYPPPEIKWLKDGVPVRASSNVRFENYPDGRVALVVDVMKPETAGNYKLLVTNKLGEAIGEAKVEVEKKPIKPEFIQRLFPQTVVEGFPVKLEVKAEGFPAPKISWFRNGAEVISDNKHIKIIEQPDGSSALFLDCADIARDALTYKAVASNEAGESDTSAALTVKEAAKPGEPEERPLFLHSIKNVITDEGQPLVIEAPFTGNPIPSAEWTKDGEPLLPSERVLMTCDGRRVGLKIDKAVPSDAGVYGVKIINPLGEDKTQGKATVRKVFMAPSFTQRFTDLQQLPNRDAKLPCRVTGVPQPEVMWTKDGQPIKESDKYHIKRDGDLCCLYILDCQPTDAGIYRATAVNQEGHDDCTATVEVVKEIKAAKRIEAPVFLKRIGDTELYKAMTAKFTACASGIPEPTVEWFHNDKKIFPSTRIKMDKDTAGLLRLTISGVDVDDLGKYSCKIYNEHGSDICHASLKFEEGLEPKPKRPITDQYTDFDKYKKSGAPMPISDPPIISQMTDRHCTLSWKPSIPSGPRVPVTYQLEMCELPSGDWFTVRSGIRSCTCGVRNLEPFRDYKFRVRVENKYGISDPSPYAITHREKLEPDLPKYRPYLPPEIDFRPETSPYFPKDFDIERPPHDGMAQAPRFLRQEHDTQYGVKDQNTNLFWYVYGYPKPKMTYYFNDELIEPGGRFDMSYTRNGQATLFINKMLERDAGCYEAVARNEHGEARQRVPLEIAEIPYFIRRPEIDYSMLRGKSKFEARIIGVPYPEIKWYKDWKPLAPSSRIKIAFIEPDITVLTIHDIILKDEGLYSVSARNVAGSTSASAMLYVEENEQDYKMRNYSNISPIKTKKRIYTDFYDIGDELGRGTQGITSHAVERLNGRNYAAKVMYGSGDFRPFMYNELDMLNELRHKKLISLHEAYETEDSLALILELASGGELVRDYLLKMDYYTESDIAGFIRQLLQGLDYMHDRGYAHMGLDLGDLLISHPGGDDLKITDFSLSRRIQHGNFYPLKYGMPEYVSPEVANGDGVGYGQDMWSVGIITYILLSGRSPFRGENDRETLTNIREGRWSFYDEWWSKISLEARDFISKLLVYDAEGRMDIRGALRHPWLERADKKYTDEFQIRSKYLSDYWRLYREWYDNASCRRWFRRRPLEGAFTHPSKMVYPPGDYDSPRGTPAPLDKTPRVPRTWEDQLPTRSPLNYEIGVIKSESHYQNGPDTYLLQLRDVDFPVRLREYMKVAAIRGPGSGYILSDENGYDWGTPIIRERRRFTDIMDEEIDDERKARINRYGSVEREPTTRRIRHELGSRLDAYVEAEAFLEAKQEGRLPFFREKPSLAAMTEGQDLELTCLAVGEPQPIVQWFKNDSIVAESHRIKIFTDADGRSHFKLTPALNFDQGLYKVVARNKIGQVVSRTRIVLGLVPDEPDSPEAQQMSDTEILLTWKQPRFDGNAAVICYSLEYKAADELDWIKKADNIDHEFYLISGLESNKSYIFRLAAKNSIGWSDPGVPSAPVTTKPSGSPKIQLSKAMLHLQQLTDSGKEVDEESKTRLDYKLESSPVEWEDSNVQQEYNFISEIARGKFSVVLKGVDKRNDTVVVAKILDYNDKTREDVEGEFAALRSLRHERIASLLAAYRTNGTAVFILEKLQGADILTYLASRHEYTEQTVATIVSQILDGLQYLHWRGLCHLDLQPDNIVMCGVRSVQIKLVDLGSAHRVTKLGTDVPVVGHPDYILSGVKVPVVGNLDYISPEVIAEEPAFPQSDIWTVGVLTYVMLSGTVPFRGQDENESRQNILFVRYRFENLFQEVTQEATRFLMLLFKRHPNKRPSPEECHENRWLLPTDYMIKKRERAVFLGHRIKEYSEEYHSARDQSAQQSQSSSGVKLIRSQSIQEELLTAP